MTTAFEHVVVNALDVDAQAAWRSEALCRSESSRDEHQVDLDAPDGDPPLRLVFVPVPQLGPARGRVHLDVRPHPSHPLAGEVARLSARGASPLDIGQGDVPWQVMGDPEGNAFCVLSAPSGVGAGG